MDLPTMEEIVHPGWGSMKERICEINFLMGIYLFDPLGLFCEL